jgi:ABC-2 type transport system permease protein
MRAALRIAAKDLRQRLRDRSALMIAVVLPLALAFIFDLVFGSASTPRPFDYAVVNLDRGHIATGFVDEVLPQIEREGFVKLRRVATPAEARALAEDGTVDAAFIVPAGFSEAVQRQASTRIDVIGDADSPTGAQVARSIASSYVAELNNIAIAVAAAVPDPGAVPPEELAGVVQRAVAATRPVELVDVSAAEKILDAKTYFAAAMAVFFLFFTVQFGVASLLDERDAGTLRRLLAAPIPRAAILGGKLLTSLVLGLVSMAVLVVATSVLMGASWGDPLGVALLVVTGVLAATGVTAVVASLAKTVEQAGSWQAVIAVTLGLLGGAFFPISQVGGVAAALSRLTPHAWFLRGLADLAGGGGVSAALPSAAALLVFAVVAGTVAALRVGKAVQP